MILTTSDCGPKRGRFLRSARMIQLLWPMVGLHFLTSLRFEPIKFAEILVFCVCFYHDDYNQLEQIGPSLEFIKCNRIV